MDDLVYRMPNNKTSDLKFKKLHPDAVIPTYATEGSAGMDVYSVENVTIEPGKTVLVSTGLAADIPDGFELQVRPRSGLAAKHGITVLNSPGTIDSDYTGEIKVILHNTQDKPYEVHKGDRIAQLVIGIVIHLPIKEVDEITKETERGSGGFGSTGK